MLRLTQCPRIESFLQTICNAEVMPNLKSLQLIQTCSPETFETITGRLAPLDTLYIVIPAGQNLPKYDRIKTYHARTLKKLWVEHQRSSYVLDNLLRNVIFEPPPGNGYDGFFLSSWDLLEELALGIDLVRDNRPIILPGNLQILRIVGTLRFSKGAFYEPLQDALNIAKNHHRHCCIKGKRSKLSIISFFVSIDTITYLVDQDSLGEDEDLVPSLTQVTVDDLPIPDLANACLVSKAVSAVAVPILYSTVALQPHPVHGIAPHQNWALFLAEGVNRHLKHILNLYVIHPKGGKRVTEITGRLQEYRLMTLLKPNQLMSLSLCGYIHSKGYILPLLAQQQNLRALHLDIPPTFEDAERFSRIEASKKTLQTLSLRILKSRADDLDVQPLINLLGQLKHLQSFDIRFREQNPVPIVYPTIWNDGIRLLDAIFSIESLQQLSLLGTDIPFGYWAGGNPNRKIGVGLTMFKTETVDRGDPDGSMCDLDDDFFFERFDPQTLKCWHFCLGVIYSDPDIPTQYPRYVDRNNKLQKLLADCSRLKELRVCNLPQMSDYTPTNHCLFRVRDTLRRLRICSNDWFGMDFLDPWVTKGQYRERQKKIIADLKALQILELTINWLDWDISSESLQLVHILREPDQSEGREDLAFDLTEETIPIPTPARYLFLEEKANEFISHVKPTLLPSFKILVFSHLNFFEEHCHHKRYSGIQMEMPERWPMVFSFDGGVTEEFSNGRATGISVSDLKFKHPWLYDGSWEGQPWSGSRKFW
ncbi:hypothetical protein H072_1836 [Dactylellina haptotyla CBS 200.50]|uniref:Uncharacterized protein n=1 Tax=Dactylellina haptotyla (strain CBS 200.50) TaxID=1284197 RepID=S8C8Y4_DACHA|nr:hypothetical protein H072_1836 [Dactylellina haptotyla CBS 200.50]